MTEAQTPDAHAEPNFNPEWLEWYLRNTVGQVILSDKQLIHKGGKP